jgi:hypothetical protein
MRSVIKGFAFVESLRWHENALLFVEMHCGTIHARLRPWRPADTSRSESRRRSRFAVLFGLVARGRASPWSSRWSTVNS